MVVKVGEALQQFTVNKLTPSERFTIIQVGPKDLLTALRVMADTLEIKHLSTITGQDLPDGIGLDYEFSTADRIIAIRAIIPKADLTMETCTKIIPGAILYEMEIHDMFGVRFPGNPWMDRKLLLPDNYPSDMPPPLLKTTSSDKIRKAVGVDE